MKTQKPPGDVPLHEWAALYDAAVAFKQLGCWEWMYDSDLFGVQNPETGEVGYCCVLGNLGEVFALNVYPGAEGLESYWALHELHEDPASDVPLDAQALLGSQKCLMASFEDRADLHKTDVRLIRELGLQFRGKKAWPLFRNYLPGFLPWFLTSREEVRFLTVALQQAQDVALKMKENPDYLTPPEDDKELYLVRVRQDERWQDTWQEPAGYEPPRTTPVINDALLHQLQHARLPREGTWEADCLLLPMAVQEGARPFYPYALIVVSESGMPLGLELLKPGTQGREVPNKFMELLQREQRLPQTLLVGSDQTFTLLEPVAARLGFAIQQTEDLPVLRFFLEHFGQDSR
ncbi:MAG: hypothetical protein AB1671_16280 [Thermodesulfobacteriota bacterium]|jgi:hypothetical protein